MNTQVQQVGHISGRSMTFVAVMGLHALVIAALILSRFTPPIIDSGPKPIEWLPLSPEAPPPEPQPRIEHRFDKPAIPTTVIPVPERFVIPKESATTVTATVDDGSAVPDVGPLVAEPRIVNVPTAVRRSTAMQFQITRSTEDYYPEASRVLEEQGATILQVCADASGRLAGVPSVQTSSGSKRLDQAAVRWARESLRVVPGTENGTAVSGCKGFRVDFTLH